MYIPNINLKVDINEETDQFVAFLHHNKFPKNRDIIFQYYPDLKLMLEKDDIDEKRVVHSFIKGKYSEYDTAIASITSETEKKIHKYGAAILEQLSLLMDYRWPKGHAGYIVIPTILPFSPFGKNIFYFSMVRKIKGNSEKGDDNHDILPLIAHEISHMMLWDILKQNEVEGMSLNYGWTVRHFLQEILAPIIMNQEPLKNILGIKNYLGNPYLEHLNIERASIQENMVIYFKNIYADMKFSDKRPFWEIAKFMADELEKISATLDKKMNMWNTYGHKIVSNEQLFEEYKRPILLVE